METDDTGIVSEYAMPPPPPHAEAAAPDRSSAGAGSRPSATARLAPRRRPLRGCAASAREITPAEEVAALPEIPGRARGGGGGGCARRGWGSGSSAAPDRDDAGASAEGGRSEGGWRVRRFRRSGARGGAFLAFGGADASASASPRARAAPPASAAPPPRGYASRLEPSPDPPRRGVGAKGARGTPGSRGSTPGSSDRAKSRRVAERELKLEGGPAAVADEAESRRRRERRRLAALEAETRAARAEESAAREARRRREALHRRTPQNPPGAFSVFAPPRDADPRGYDFQTPPPQRAPRHHLAAPYEGAGYGDHPEYDQHHHPEYDDDHPEYAHHPEYERRVHAARRLGRRRRGWFSALGASPERPRRPPRRAACAFGRPSRAVRGLPEARAARELLRGGGRAPRAASGSCSHALSAGGGAAPTSVSAEEAKLLRSLRRLDAHCLDPGGAHRTEPGDQCAHDAIHTRRSTVDGLLDRPLESRRSAEEARLLASPRGWTARCNPLGRGVRRRPRRPARTRGRVRRVRTSNRGSRSRSRRRVPHGATADVCAASARAGAPARGGGAPPTATEGPCATSGGAPPSRSTREAA